jgi:hypothetical protein
LVRGPETASQRFVAELPVSARRRGNTEGDLAAVVADYQTALFTIAPGLFRVMQNYL